MEHDTKWRLLSCHQQLTKVLMAFGIPVARKIGQIHYWDGHGEEVSFYLKPLYCNDLLLKQVLLNQERIDFLQWQLLHYDYEGKNQI